MHLGHLASYFNDFNGTYIDDQEVLQIQNDCIATVTVLLQQQHNYKVPRQRMHDRVLDRTTAPKPEPIQSALTTGEHCKSPR